MRHGRTLRTDSGMVGRYAPTAAESGERSRPQCGKSGHLHAAIGRPGHAVFVKEPRATKLRSPVRWWLGLSCSMMALGIAGAFVDTPVQSVGLVAVSLGLVVVWVRLFRCGVNLTGNELVIQSFLRAKHVARSEIRSVGVFEASTQWGLSPMLITWAPKARLISGAEIELTVLSGYGRAARGNRRVSNQSAALRLWRDRP